LKKKISGASLDSEEKAEYQLFRKRIEKICEHADSNDVPVYIDAEHSWTQDIIDEFARELMIRYNKEKVIVYNTIQMYRHGAD
jgi:proline dehydrogenase